jgi:hypothetical protein
VRCFFAVPVRPARVKATVEIVDEIGDGRELAQILNRDRDSQILLESHDDLDGLLVDAEVFREA